MLRFYKENEMPSQSRFHVFFKNLYYAFLAQGVSLLLSILMSLIVPKILGVHEYGYWQLFLLYSGFVGFFHFGLNDGIYLRYGGTDYNRLNYKLLGSQLWFSIAAQSVMALLAILYAVLFIHDSSRSFVIISTAIYLVLNNSCSYLWFVFQLSNRAKVYSLSVIINRLFFMISVIVLLFCKTRTFQTFVILYEVAQILALVYSAFVARKIVFVHFISLKRTIRQVLLNIVIGINLMFSNVADMLVISTGRFVVDSLWGITVFGKISFALSLTYFFLLFIGQVSIVLFPNLRQMNIEQLKYYFELGRDILCVLLTGIFLAYFPIKLLLSAWLPQYHESLNYMAFLLPLCTYDGKMQMLCGTYFKVLRKERLLLLINVMTFLLSAVSALVGGYVLHSIYFIIFSMVFSIGIRSIFSEILLSKRLQISYAKSILAESFLAIVYILCSLLFNSMTAFLIYIPFYLLYLFLSRNVLRSILDNFKRLLKNRMPLNS